MLLPVHSIYKTVLVSLIIAFTVIQSGSAQKKHPNFSVFVDSVIVMNHRTYNDIEYAIYKNKYDTLKMRILERKSESANYVHGTIFAKIMLGIQYRNKSFFEKSTTILNEALALSKENALLEFEIIALNMLGVNYRRQNIVKESIDYHQKALSLAEKESKQTKNLQKSIAVSYNSMGNIYLMLKQYDLALEQFSKSITIELQLKNKLGLAINNHNIGIIHEANNNLDLALSSYKKSLGYNNEINSNVGKILCNNSIGSIYLKQNKPDLALSVIKPTIALAEAQQDQFYIANAYVTYGTAQNQLNQHRAAKESLTKGLEVAKKYKLKSSIANSYFELSKLNEKLGDHKLSLSQYRQAVTLDQEINNENNSEYASLIRFQYENEKKNNQIESLNRENEIVNLKLQETRKTWLFYLLGLFLFATGLFSYYRHRQLKNEKKIITLEQDMLRSQMNPHFIFNSLNSIKLYIINNEKENAVYYLNKFSKLIRKILIASSEKEITLKEELETMALYINIENIRFSNQINYKLVIDDSINTEAIKLPSLVLQPFLENALWHGLSPKTTDKKIYLEVLKNKPDYITIIITDNGIGRIASKKIKDNKKLKQKSLGIAITKQRLKNFSKSYLLNYQLEIVDLYQEGTPSGTKVIIDIPYKALHKLKTA